MEALAILVLMQRIALVAAASTTKETLLPEVIRNAQSAPHVLFVNVDNALDNLAFADGVEKILSLLPINIWTNSISRSLIPEMVTKPAILKERFGVNAELIVFIERDAKRPSFIQVPGLWAVVNVCGLDKDSPSVVVLRERTRKMFLKGMALVSGVGANADRRCAMWSGSFTLEGMDKTTTSLGPHAVTPMIDIIKTIGGKEIFRLPEGNN